MKMKELNDTRRLITKVLSKPKLGPGQRDDLRKAKRELDNVAQSGKLDRQRIFRATELIATTLLDVLELTEAER